MGVFDIEDLIARTHELASFVEEAVHAYELDARKVVAVGFSNGANIAASILLLRPKVVRGAALLHAMVPFQPEKLPDLTGTSVLLTGGLRDSMVPQEQTEQLGRMLADGGAELTLHWEPGGHQLTQAEIAKTAEWLREVESTD
jgi:predicted esterase